MTKYGIFSDVHANIPALEAVLSHMDKSGVEDRVCLGDIVVYGPFPVETVALLDKEGILKNNCVLGNNDKAIRDNLKADSTMSQLLTSEIDDAQVRLKRASTRAIHLWTLAQMWGEQWDPGQELDALSLTTDIRRLGNLRDRKVIGSALYLHASPCEPVGMEGNYLRSTADAEEAFFETRNNSDLDYPLCFFGHTHMPTIFEVTTEEMEYANVQMYNKVDLHSGPISVRHSNGDFKRMLVNPGSVGQPRDGNPDSSYVIYDDEAGTIEFHRVSFELQPVLEKFRQEKTNLAYWMRTDELDNDLSDQVASALIERFRNSE